MVDREAVVPMETPRLSRRHRPGVQAAANRARKACQPAAEEGRTTWRLILAEEFWEVLAETDPEKVGDELVQLAALPAA